MRAAQQRNARGQVVGRSKPVGTCVRAVRVCVCGDVAVKGANTAAAAGQPYSKVATTTSASTTEGGMHGREQHNNKRTRPWGVT